MPETPPASTPTAEDTEQCILRRRDVLPPFVQLDQAAADQRTTEQGSAGHREPPQPAAGNDSSQATASQVGPQRAQPASIGRIQAESSINAASRTASDATPKDTPSTQQQPQEASTAASQPEPQKEQGNVPPQPPAARDGPARVLLSPTGQPLARDALGRLYNPAKGEPPRKDGPKAQSAALLKPDGTRAYGDSATQAGSNSAESQPLNPGITGLSDIPSKWGELPSNVSLSVEIAWVQSERLRVVKETPGRGVKVDLSKARAPAPSMSALSWLETSIRSYSKFVEVASKQASGGQDEAEFVRRERMQVGEIRGILEEMKAASG